MKYLPAGSLTNINNTQVVEILDGLGLEGPASIAPRSIALLPDWGNIFLANMNLTWLDPEIFVYPSDPSVFSMAQLHLDNLGFNTLLKESFKTVLDRVQCSEGLRIE